MAGFVARWLSDALRVGLPLALVSVDIAGPVAQQGGIGVIHKNYSIDQQAEEVDKVKRSESGMIVDPVTIHKDALVSEALGIMERFRISGVPVVDDGGVAASPI